MSKYIFLLISLVVSITAAQEIKSPSEFLGYELGTQFTRHHEVVDYYEYLAKVAPNRVQLHTYGQTNERRPLLLIYISAAKNMSRLSEIKADHIKSTLGEGTSNTAIVWLSYNVHGNESVGTEASMQTTYELLTEKAAYLENTVVLIDPCVNPDGRDRYINWYNQYKNTPFTIDLNSKEHHEGWWTGRSNHYMFDLNRDWAWLTQVESRARLKMYNKWLPHIHADFHEQGIDNPYYFAPAAEPFHEVITNFQRDFQGTIGKNHAKYFDAKGWFYFTKEVYDLFYPSYGDTYPTYNGAIGMTYEQGGSGQAGLGVQMHIGDTLTLKDRIAHHHTTGLSTVEVASKNASKLNEEFRKYYTTKNFKYKSYVLQGNQDNITALTRLLDKHEITYGAPSAGTVKGYRYKTGKTGSFRTTNESLVVSTNQPKGTLVKVLFEPDAKLSDSLTYDITAWSLPFAYGLDAIASENIVNARDEANTNKSLHLAEPGAYAYVSDWNSMIDARFLAALLQKKIRVRTAYEDFSVENHSFKRGSLIITKADNSNRANFYETLKTIAQKYKKEITSISTGFVDSGKDFGSPYVQMITKPKVAVLSGGGTSTLRFGEIWHFFEQQLHYPLAVLDEAYLDAVDLSSYSILILPSGSYGEGFKNRHMERLKKWVQDGGKLIAMGGAIQIFEEDKSFTITRKQTQNDSANTLIEAYSATQRERIKNAITGAIFKTRVDTTHPLAYGYDDTYFSLKLGNTPYQYLDQGTVAYIGKNSSKIAGFAGSEALKQTNETLVFGVDNVGSGQVIYMVDNPLFRGFWENGKLFFANALFMLN